MPILTGHRNWLCNAELPTSRKKIPKFRALPRISRIAYECLAFLSILGPEPLLPHSSSHLFHLYLIAYFAIDLIINFEHFVLGLFILL